MSEWISNALSVGAAVFSAVATGLAWQTSRSALKVAQQTERSAAEDRLSTARERYELSVSRLRLHSSKLIAVVNDSQQLINSQALKNDSLSSSRTKLQLQEVERFTGVAEKARKLLDGLREKMSEDPGTVEFNDANRNIQLLLIPVDAALERMIYLRSRIEIG